MSRLFLNVRAADKAMDAEGEVAFGETVAVAVKFEDAEIGDSDSLRLRVRYNSADVAVFPLNHDHYENLEVTKTVTIAYTGDGPYTKTTTTTKSWTYDGETHTDTEESEEEVEEQGEDAGTTTTSQHEDVLVSEGDHWSGGEDGEATCSLNLNTEQLRAVFGPRPRDGQSVGAILWLDCVDTGGEALHAEGGVRIRWWDANETISGVEPAPAPVDIGEWARQMGERMTDAEADLAELDTAVAGKASAAVVSELQTVVSTHTSSISTLAASVQSNTQALAGKVNAVDGKGLSANDYSDEEKAKVANAVQSEAGKGLSANDFTDALKAKLDGIESGATNVAVDSQITEDSANAVSSGAVFAMKTHLHQKIEEDVEDGVEEAKSYTDSQIATAVSAVFRYKGSKETYADLPSSGNEVGDVWNVEAAYGSVAAGTNWAWNGSAWDALAGQTPIDSSLDGSSVNPVQNKVVKAALDGKAPIDRGYIQISNGHIQAVIP